MSFFGVRTNGTTTGSSLLDYFAHSHKYIPYIIVPSVRRPSITVAVGLAVWHHERKRIAIGSDKENRINQHSQ